MEAFISPSVSKESCHQETLVVSMSSDQQKELERVNTFGSTAITFCTFCLVGDMQGSELEQVF